MYTLRFDGLFREVSNGDNEFHKAGFMCYGWLISRSNIVIARGHGAFADGKEATSNIAEYLALIEGLEALIDLNLDDEPIRILGDSKCIIDQMQGYAAVNSPSMISLNRRAQRLVNQFSRVRWSWTPRKFNKEADSLTRRAMRQIRQDRSRYQEILARIHPRNRQSGSKGKMLPLIDLRVYHHQPM